MLWKQPSSPWIRRVFKTRSRRTEKDQGTHSQVTSREKGKQKTAPFVYVCTWMHHVPLESTQAEHVKKKKDGVFHYLKNSKFWNRWISPNILLCLIHKQRPGHLKSKGAQMHTFNSSLGGPVSSFSLTTRLIWSLNSSRAKPTKSHSLLGDFALASVGKATRKSYEKLHTVPAQQSKHLHIKKWKCISR